MVVDPAGRTARTEVRVVARCRLVDLLRLDLHTGRTHQIRVHLAHIGHPVVGDPVYGGGGSRRISGADRIGAGELERLTPRQALHAAWLQFRHPLTGVPLEFQSEWPGDLGPALAAALGPANAVAPLEALRYLRFFEAHG
jgi:23S rRNA pseudouridine1911/1915/1917 synthase